MQEGESAIEEIKEVLNKKNTDKLFEWGILIKSLIGLFEILAGILFAFSGKQIIHSFILFFGRQEIIEDPNDKFVTYLTNLTDNLTHSTEFFAVFYLIFHGMMNIVLSIALAKKKVTWYPVIMGLFGLFALYQLYRFLHGHSLILLGLITFDFAFIGIIYLEYRRSRPKEKMLL